MAAGRTLKSLVGRRRRADDEGEDEEGPFMVGDSQSEGSALSGPDDEEGDESSLGDTTGARLEGVEEPEAGPGAASNGSAAKKTRKAGKKTSKNTRETSDHAQVQPAFKAMADTDAMMNGLRISNDTQEQEEAVDFESAGQNGTAITSAPSNDHPITPAERQRREHEEYKRKRDSDPAFTPNRGNFFMHDTRGQPNGQAPQQRGVWQARGRGRGGLGGANMGGPFSPANQMAQAERAAEQPWKHDLHDTINEEPQAQVPTLNKIVDGPPQQPDSNRLFPKPAAPPAQNQPRVLSFSSTTLVGKVQIRVWLPGMKAPLSFPEVPWKHYIRLPDHRPPLRRDKPVRVSLPGHSQRYIFPSTDRSFIFIPRQMRPNQQGFHRGYQRSIGGYGYSSRRTSMYGASVYAPSIAASRRSSLASTRENAFSPVGSFVGMPPSRPIVRLPHGAQQHFSAVSTPVGPLSGHHTPTGIPQIHTYPLPQQPALQGTPTTTVHQPRPQKAISVTGIESPAMLQQAPGEPQPFQNQLPAHMTDHSSYPQQPPPPYFSPRQQYQYSQQQPQAGTPLSGIPEQAIHASSFQPPPNYGQPPYYSPYPPQQNYYYSPPGQNGSSQMPMYMVPPPPPQNYMGPPQGQMPAQPPPPPPPQPPSQPTEEHQQQASQSGMVAHESNGMVFYVPASEAQQSDRYQPAESFVPSYAMPGLPPTPAPDSSMGYYYPQMPHSGMQEVGSGVYYPAQQ